MLFPLGPPNFNRTGPECRGSQGVAVRVRSAARVAQTVSRKNAEGGFVVVDSQTDLVQIVRALASGRGGSYLLDGGQQETDEDRDDRIHDQQFDEGEPAPLSHRVYLQMAKLTVQT